MLQALLSQSPRALKRAGALLPGLLLAGVMVSLPAHAQQGSQAPTSDDEPAAQDGSQGEPNKPGGPNGPGEPNGPDGSRTEVPAPNKDASSSTHEDGALAVETPPQGGTTAGSARARPGPVAQSPVRHKPLSRGGRVDTADDGAGMRDPAYFISGVITLSVAGAFAVGGVIALATDDTEPPPLPPVQSIVPEDQVPPPINQPQTAIGLVGFAAGCATLGVPLLLLGAASEQPESPEAVAAGTALATAGVAIAGTGAAFGMAQASYVDEPQFAPQGGGFIFLGLDTDAGPIALPLTLGIAGAAMTVVGVVVWAGGAGEADDGGEAGEEDTARKPQPPQSFSAQLTAGPGSLGLSGHF